jgi:hypothetical protein
MIWRLNFFMKRRGDATRAQFVEHILGDYASLVARDPVIAPAMTRFTVHLPVPELPAGLPDEYDVVAQLEFADEAAATASLLRLRREPGLVEAGERLMDFPASVSWIGELRPKYEVPVCGAKLLVGGDVADGMRLDIALAYWNGVHPVVAQTAPEHWNKLRIYRQIHGRPVPGTGRNLPMAADIGYESLDVLATAFDGEQYLAIIRPDEMKFSKPQDMLAFVTTDERRLYDPS